MNIYKISREDWDYDDYDSAIVIAENEDQARMTNPRNGEMLDPENFGIYGWAESPDLVTVELVGIALPDAQPGLILSSYNAG